MREKSIAEFDCLKEGEDLAVKALEEAMERNVPMVFRSCMRAMPAVEKWSRTRYLKQKSFQYKHFGKQFSILWDKLAESTSNVVPSELIEDTRWNSTPFGRMLTDFTDSLEAVTAWVSRGHRKAETHFDTFENLHSVVMGQKRFYLISPEFAAHMYLDFPPKECAEQFGDYVGSQSFGCDGLGCYGYVPFSDQAIDLSLYPGIKQASLEVSTLGAGDVIFIPSFWFHHIWHLPEQDGITKAQKTIAVTFSQQRRWPNMTAMLPFAADILSLWKSRVASSKPQHTDGAVRSSSHPGGQPRVPAGARLEL